MVDRHRHERTIVLISRIALARIIHWLSSFRCKVMLRKTLQKAVLMQTVFRNPLRKRGILLLVPRLFVGL